MTLTKEQISAFHSALHEACGLPALRPSMSDERLWWDFLREMEPLADEADGPFNSADIAPVIRYMQRECRDGKASWSLRPTHILRNPETFRDLVLITRKERRSRRMAERRTAPVAPAAPVEDRMTPEEALEAIQRMKREMNEFSNRKGGAA